MDLTRTQIILLVLLLILIVLYLSIGRHSLRALLSGFRLTPTQALFMRLRKSPVKLIVDQLLRARKAGIILDLDELEACSLAGGDVKNIVNGMILANAKGIEFSFKEAILLDRQKNDLEVYLQNK